MCPVESNARRREPSSSVSFVVHRSFAWLPALACPLLFAAACKAGTTARPETLDSQSTPALAQRTQVSLPAGPFVEILGVAQDAGVPQAGCSSPNCEAARSDPARVRYATSLALVGTGGETYLFEATPDLRPQLQRTLELGKQRGRAEQGRKLLDGIFVTHAHMGHYSGLLHLGFEAAHSQGVPLYASPRMQAFLSENQPWRQLIELSNVVPSTLNADSAVTLADGVTVRAVTVPHRDELSDTLAWRIEGPQRTLLFMPDCDPWSRWEKRGFDLDPMLEGVDLFVVDATFYSSEELPGRDLSKIGHPMVEDSLLRLGPRVQKGGLEVVFIHFNHSNPLLDEARPEARNLRAAGFELAERGMQIEL